MKIKASIGTIIFNTINYIFLSVISICTLIPFIAVLSGSFTAEKELIINGVSLIPRVFSLDAYRQLLADKADILNSYKITLFVTIFGSLASMFFTCMLAYVISLKHLKLKNHIAFFVSFTMLFHGGIIPWYILCTRYLSLKDTIWALIIPMLINPYYMFLIRNSFKQIPESLRESGIIDGAGEFVIFLRIIIPVSKPILATVGLFYMLAYWNNFNLALYLIDSKKLVPLQFHLYRIISNLNYLATYSPDSAGPSGNVIIPTEGIKFATTIVTIGPIILVYQFIQKYFVKGIMVGAIKG